MHLAAFGAVFWVSLSGGAGSGRSMPTIGFVAAAAPEDLPRDDAEPERELVPPEMLEPSLVERDLPFEASVLPTAELELVPMRDDQRAIAKQLALEWSAGRAAPQPDAGGSAAAASVAVASESPAPVSAVAVPPPEPIVVAATLATHVEPPYPRMSRRLGEQGTVTVRIDVRADGSVGDVAIVESSGHERLDRAALGAIATWRFEPARRDGTPIPWSLDHRVTFTLR